jgi:hypothetical protein
VAGSGARLKELTKKLATRNLPFTGGYHEWNAASKKHSHASEIVITR